MIGGVVMTGPGRNGRGMAAAAAPAPAGGHFQRKWTKIRPKFLESFSTR